MELFETLSSALREKEAEAQNLQLNRLKMELEARLQFQATTYEFEDELQVDTKAAEVQALRNRLKNLLDQVEARARGPPVEMDYWLKIGFNDIKNIFQNTGTASTSTEEKVVKGKAMSAKPKKAAARVPVGKAGARALAGKKEVKEAVKKNKSPFVFGKK
jgi:hypothetical protein